jgi:rhodanese-related sulfurtransferase
VDYETLSAFVDRQPLLSMGLVGLTIAIIINELSPLFRGYKALRPAQLTTLINREGALVVDLRSYNEFEKGHIPGAKNLPLNLFEPDSKPLVGAKETPVVVVCQSGASAGGAARTLKNAGFTKVSILDGGISAWQSADLPLVKGRG